MKPEHFKVQLNCCYCIHFIRAKFEWRCTKHDFILTDWEYLHGFCNDFERDK
jgi:hypothetical protein